MWKYLLISDMAYQHEICAVNGIDRCVVDGIVRQRELDNVCACVCPPV